MSDTTCKQAGRIGGTTTRDRHGQAHFKAIGRLGGEKLLAQRGKDYYRAIGRLAQAKRRGSDS